MSVNDNLEVCSLTQPWTFLRLLHCFSRFVFFTLISFTDYTSNTRTKQGDGGLSAPLSHHPKIIRNHPAATRKTDLSCVTGCVMLSLTPYCPVKMVDVLFSAEPVRGAIMKVAQRQIEKLGALRIRSCLTITSQPRLSFNASINTTSRRVGSAPCVNVGRTSSVL